MKNNIYTAFRSLSIIAAVFLGIQSYSQEMKHQFTAAAGGFFAPINYSLKSGDVKQGYGISIGFRYSYYLNSNWSIGIGTEYQNFNATAEIDLVKGNYMAIDSEGEQFDFRYNAAGYKEKQSLQYVTIPLNFQFEGTGYPGFYASVGAKVGFALKGTYEASIDNLSTSGYYPQYDVELFDPRFAGFGNFGSVNQGKQDLDINVAYLATLEFGIKRYLNTNSALYIGLYIDYGLNDILSKDVDKNIVEFNENIPVDFKYNSILESSYADAVNIMAYGLKVRYAFW